MIYLMIAIKLITLASTVVASGLKLAATGSDVNCVVGNDTSKCPLTALVDYDHDHRAFKVDLLYQPKPNVKAIIAFHDERNRTENELRIECLQTSERYVDVRRFINNNFIRNEIVQRDSTRINSDQMNCSFLLDNSSAAFDTHNLTPNRHFITLELITESNQVISYTTHFAVDLCPLVPCPEADYDEDDHDELAVMPLWMQFVSIAVPVVIVSTACALIHGGCSVRTMSKWAASSKPKHRRKRRVQSAQSPKSNSYDTML